jgi:hypothetical protein
MVKVRVRYRDVNEGRYVTFEAEISRVPCKGETLRHKGVLCMINAVVHLDLDQSDGSDAAAFCTAEKCGT